MRLQPRLDEITQSTRALVQPERLATSERLIADLVASGVEQGALAAGAMAPAFALPDALNGKLIRSDDLLALGPLIISFFRGRWDPYCMTELEVWRDLYPEVRQRGGLLVAVSPQTARQSDFTAQQHGIPFPLLHDADSALATQFGIAHSVPPEMDRYYRSILVNLSFINQGRNVMTPRDSPGLKLPLPATFVVAPTGMVRFAETHADPRIRPEPEDVLRYL